MFLEPKFIEFPFLNSSDGSYHSDQKQALLKKLGTKFQNPLHASSYKGEPNLEYEQYRRRINDNIQEFWNYISAETEKMQKTNPNPDSQKQLSNFLAFANENKR
jgi:hypothetical protein